MNNVDSIFNAAARVGNHFWTWDSIRAKKKQIADCRATLCGNCDHWMKSTCVPEKQHGEFKSMNSKGCEIFKPNDYVIPLAEKAEAELAAIYREYSIVEPTA